MLYQTLEALGWDYVIRLRGNILVEHGGLSKTAGEWVPTSGRARRLQGASVTLKKSPVGAAVFVREKNMKDAWCLAPSLGEQQASANKKLYGRRFTVEETFRDQKDLRLGMERASATPSDAIDFSCCSLMPRRLSGFWAPHASGPGSTST